MRERRVSRGGALILNILLSLLAGSFLLLGTSAASAGTWQTADSRNGLHWEEWNQNNYGPFATFAEAKTAAAVWCVSILDHYVVPGLDCTVDHAGSEIIGPLNGYTDPWYGTTVQTTWGPFLHGTIKFANGPPVIVIWPMDTKDGDCPAGQGVDSEAGHGCADKRHHLEPPPEPLACSVAQGNVSPFHELNPCNPADGTKSQAEVDYSTSGEGAVDFVRYYNSSGPHRTGAHMGAGWRHNYSKRIDEPADKKHQIAISSPGARSSDYTTTASEACTDGWTEIKNDVYGGDLSTAIATFSGDNVCAISSGGVTKANFVVRSGIGWQGYDGIVLPSTTKILTRPDGSRIIFENDGGVWSSKTNPGEKLTNSFGLWTYTDINGVQERYSVANGRLYHIIYANGQQETLTYSSSGGDYMLTGVTGYFRRQISFAYTDGLLSQVTTPDGVISYAYDANENLTTVTYPDLTVRTYHYEDIDLPTHLTGITDENNDRFATWSYDDAGRAISSEHAGGKERVDLAYNANGTTTLTMASGASRVYNYTVAKGGRKLTSLTGDVCGTCSAGDIANRTYDANGHLDEVTDWSGNVTQTVRNSRGLTETLIEAKGSTEERTTTNTWHASYPVPTQVVTPKNTTTYTHDSTGDILTATAASGALSRTWTMTYANDGRVLTVNGPRTDLSDVTTLTYHPFGTQMYGQVHTITNALGHVTTFNSYDAAARPTLVTDANGLQTAFTYDWRGNVLTVVQTPTVGTARTTTMTYDDVGQLATLTTPDGMVLTYTYSAAHYLTKVTDNLGNYIDYDYDVMGNLVDEDTYDSGAVLERAMDYAYDLNNRLDTVTNGGFLSNLNIDSVGNLTNVVDPELASTTHSYDALNRLEQTIDALTGVIDFGYDDHDNLTSLAAVNGATTTYVYDDLDNLTQEVSPDRGTTTYTYDEAGNRKTQTDARSKLTSYTYDALNRLALVTFDDLSTIAYEYDVGTNAKGRLNKITDSSGTTTWTFDNFGAVTQKVQTVGAVALTTAYGYDTAGRLSTMTYPSGKVATYGYNTYLPVSVSVDGTTILSGATYDPFGPVNGWTWGNASTASRAYDLRGLPTTISFAGSNQTLGYDNAGQVISQLDSVFNVNYDYDLLGRLTDFTNNTVPPAPLPASQVMTYDANGNRASLTEDAVLYAYANQTNSNRVLSTAGPTAKTYSYDLAGNITADGIHIYGYDDRGRLTDVDSGAATYVHNGQGQRVKKDNGTVTLFVYNEGGNLIGEYDSVGTAVQETVWFAGAPVAVLQGLNKYYVHTDHLGTPRAISDGNTVIWRWLSEPFGVTAPDQDPDGDLNLFTYNLRFPGQYYDVETGLHYNYFRTYDPSTGRYLESDPIGLGGGLNTYGYGYQNPLSYTDPKGLTPAVAVCLIPGVGWVGCGTAALVGGAALGIAYLTGQMAVDAIADRPRDSSRPIEPPEKLPFPIPLPNTLTMDNTSLEECERDCDLEWDRNKTLCDMISGTRDGFNSPAYKMCMNRIDRAYVECLQNCAEECE